MSVVEGSGHGVMLHPFNSSDDELGRILFDWRVRGEVHAALRVLDDRVIDLVYLHFDTKFFKYN